jgi:hypothetical protein
MSDPVVVVHPAAQQHRAPQVPVAARVSSAVTELLTLLQLDVDVPVGPIDPNPPQPVPVVEPSAEQRQQTIMDKLRAKLASGYKEDPPGATAAEVVILTAQRKKLLDELRRLELGDVRLRRADDAEQLTKVAADVTAVFAATKDAIQARENIRGPLTLRLPQLVPDTGVTDATGLENTELLRQRQVIATELKSAETLQALQLMPPKVEQLTANVRVVENAVEDRRERKRTVEASALLVQDPPDAAKDFLKAKRDAVPNVFLAKPLSKESVEEAETKLAELIAAQRIEEARLIPLRKERDLDITRLKAIDQDFKAFMANVGQRAKGKAEGMIADCRKALTRPLTETMLTDVENQIWLLRAEMLSVASAGYSNQNAVPDLLKYVTAEAQKLSKEAASFADLNTAVIDGKAEAVEEYKAFQKLLVGTPSKVLQTARPRIEALGRIVAQLHEDAGPAQVKLSARQSQLLIDVAEKLPADLAADFTGLLQAARVSIEHLLSGVLIEASVNQADTQLIAFQTMLKRAKADAAATQRVTATRHNLAQTVAATKAALRGPLRQELQRAYDIAEACASAPAPARDMPKAEKLFNALVARITEMQQEPPVGAGTFTTIVVTVNPTAGFPTALDAQQQVADLCGGELLNGLSPAEITELCNAVAATSGPEIKDFVNKGLGGKPKLLAAIIKRSGGKGLAAIATAFANDDAAHSALINLVDNGGLTENPEVIGSLLGHGIDALKPDGSAPTEGEKTLRRTGNAAKMKALVLGFADAGGPAAMDAMLSGGGLGTSPIATAPPAIASLMHDGFDGDANKVRGFADACTGDDPDKVQDRANLKNLITTAGVGHHPSVLGPLVKTSGVGKLKGVGTTFAAGNDAANLKTLLDQGGMSGDTSLPGKTHEHPDTLAKVFHDGFGDSPDKLKQYATAFRGEPNQSKQMLDAFNEWPAQFRAEREPGKDIKKLLDKWPAQGGVGKLQTQFTANIVQIPQVEAGAAPPPPAPGQRRKEAFRFAPSFCTAPAQDQWADPGGAMDTAGVKKVLAFVSRRHSPETFEPADVNHENSQFPPGTDVRAMANAAVAAMVLPIVDGVAQTVTVGNFLLEIAIGPAAHGGGKVIYHFGPREHGLATPHPDEAPNFLRTQIEAILRSIS